MTSSNNNYYGKSGDGGEVSSSWTGSRRSRVVGEVMGVGLMGGGVGGMGVAW
jgi:hypothetical protein